MFCSLILEGMMEFKTQFSSPTDVFSILSSSSSSSSSSYTTNVSVLSLPSLDVTSSSTGLHPAMAPLGRPSDPQSWHCLLTGAALFTLLSGSVEYVLHPLSMEVSIATVRSATPSQAVGIGVHADMKALHLSFNKQQVETTHVR